MDLYFGRQTEAHYKFRWGGVPEKFVISSLSEFHEGELFWKNLRLLDQFMRLLGWTACLVTLELTGVVTLRTDLLTFNN